MTTRHALAGAAGLAVLLAACSNPPENPQHPTVTIQPTSAALCVGDNVTFAAEVRDANGQPMSGVALTWSSSAPDVIDIGASGVGHALRTGSSNVTATAQGVTSNRATIDVPADLAPEFVPDSVVLAPGDTMTLGVRLRRISGGLVPAHTPVVTPFDGAVAGLDASGLVHAKAVGRAGLTLTACGLQGGGAVDVVSPTDAVTGSSYLWLSGPEELRVRLPAGAVNFTRANGRPAFQVYGRVGNNARVFLYEDTVALSGAGAYPLDSILTSEAGQPNLACAPPRPFALYLDQAALTLLLGVTGGPMRVTTYAPQTGYTAVSGRLAFRIRGVVRGGAQVDTLNAIYTFSAPLVDSAGACP
jgi:hypothetical protein